MTAQTEQQARAGRYPVSACVKALRPFTPGEILTAPGRFRIPLDLAFRRAAVAWDVEIAGTYRRNGDKAGARLRIEMARETRIALS